MIPVEAVRAEGGDEPPWLPLSSRLIRAVSEQIAAMRVELRMGLPVLGREDLRRYRMYDAGSVLLELLGSGEDGAAQTLWQLLQLDGVARRELDSAAARALRRPPLASCPELLHALATGLAASNKAARDGGDRGAAAAHTLRLAELAWARGLGWWWLTERLLEMAEAACSGWRQDAGLSEASVALAHGAFLLHQLQEPGESLPKLTLAAQLSAGQPWAASPALLRLLPEQYRAPQTDSEDGGVFRAASRALGEGLLLEARLARKEQDHGRASALCREAVQRAHDARSPALELRAERELGVCLLAAGRPGEAMDTFRALLALAQSGDSPRDVVDAHLKLALCCNSQSDVEGTLRSLRDARAAAEELRQPDLLAKAHGHLGEYFLNTTRSHYATTHFHRACALYGGLAHPASAAPAGLAIDKREADRMRALAGVAGGQEVWSSLVAAVRDCDPAAAAALRRRRLLQLVAWKDRRAPFWPDKLAVSWAVRSLHRPLPAVGQEGEELPLTKGVEEASQTGSSTCTDAGQEEDELVQVEE